MIAKGRDASELFPAVVKNVVSKNIEVKKLVYVYLVRYAEQQQDLALLTISTFQRALKVIYFEWKYYKIKFKIIEGSSARTGHLHYFKIHYLIYSKDNNQICMVVATN